MKHSEEHDLVGMDPGKMQALIGELRTAHHTIAAFAAEFAAPLSAHGISVNTVRQAEHWTADQVSRLTERLHKLQEAGHTVPPMAGPPGGSGATGTGAGGTGATGTGAGGNGAGGNGAGGTGAGPGTGAHAGGTSSGAGAGAAPAGGYPYGAGAGGLPAPYRPAASPAPHTARPPAADPHQHAVLSARHVSRAAQHGQSFPERVWDDIERNASNPQYAGAFLAALGAAGLALLGASIAKSRKKSKDQAEADRRQAALDELLASAQEYDFPAEAAQLPEPAQELGIVSHAAGPGHEREPAAGPGDQPGRPRLRLVTAGSAPSGQTPAGPSSGSAPATEGS